MGRRCPEESLEGDTALAGDLLEEEDWEWLTALGVAIAPPRPRPGGAGVRPPGQQGAPKPVQGPPPAKGDQKKQGPAPGKWAVAPRAGLTLPARVKERQYDRDDQRREAVP